MWTKPACWGVQLIGLSLFVIGIGLQSLVVAIIGIGLIVLGGYKVRQRLQH